MGRFLSHFQGNDPQRYLRGCQVFATRANSLLEDGKMANWEKFRRLGKLRDEYLQDLERGTEGRIKDGLLVAVDDSNPALPGVLATKEYVSDFLNHQVRVPAIFGSAWAAGWGLYLGKKYRSHFQGKIPAIKLRLPRYLTVAMLLLDAGILVFHFFGKESYTPMGPAACYGAPGLLQEQPTTSPFQFFREIAVPIFLTSLFATFATPPLALVARHFIVKSRLHLKVRRMSPGVLRSFLDDWSPLRSHGKRLRLETSSGLRRPPFPDPIPIGNVHQAAKNLAQKRGLAAATDDARRNEWNEALRTFQGTAQAWSYQISPTVAVVGGLMGLLTPQIMRVTGDRNYLSEEYFDNWPSILMMYVCCTISGGLTTWIGHNAISAPLAKWFVTRVKALSLGYLTPYLLLPYVYFAAMAAVQFFFLPQLSQFLRSVDGR